MKEDQKNELPNAIKLLNQGGLTIVSPLMLPYLRAVLSKVTSLVNNDMSKEHGQYMVEVAYKELENDDSLQSAFVSCLRRCNPSIKPCPSILAYLHQEFSRKLFHSRVNEYLTASVELELERSGKVVTADQSLRDQLKTYSGMKTR